MTNFEVTQIYQCLDKEINHLIQSALINHKKASKRDAEIILSTLKKYLNIWIIQLEKEKLSYTELEFLIFEEMKLIELNNLKSVGVSKGEIDLFKEFLLRLIGNVIINSTILEKQFFLKENYR